MLALKENQLPKRVVWTADMDAKLIELSRKPGVYFADVRNLDGPIAIGVSAPLIQRRIKELGIVFKNKAGRKITGRS